MNEPPPEEQELSAEDKAILEAFHAMQIWKRAPSEPSLSPETSSAQQNTSGNALDDMLTIFFSEVEEDLVVMHASLHQLEQQNGIDPTCLVALQRIAHKLHGTAGMMSYSALAVIAFFIERIVEAITSGKVVPLLGTSALARAVVALETTFKDLVEKGTENDAPRKELEAYLQKFALDLQEP